MALEYGHLAAQAYIVTGSARADAKGDEVAATEDVDVELVLLAAPLRPIVNWLKQRP